MAQIVLNIPPGQIARVVDALCKAGGYTGDVGDTAARTEFARHELRKYLRRTVLEVERREALAAAMAVAPTVAPVDVS